MSHLLCPLCGKYTALSTLNPEELELALKVVSFKSLGRGNGFRKSEEYSILGDDEYTPLIANRIEKLYYWLIDSKILTRIIDDSTLNLINANIELRNQLASMNSRMYSLNKENKEKDIEIEGLELRSHVDYIISESLSLDKSAKLKFDEDSYYMVITQKTTALNLYLYFLMQELPDRLKEKILQRVNGDDYPIYLQILKTVEPRGTVADELMGEKLTTEFNYSGIKPYTLKLDELKKIVNEVKRKIYNPKEMMREHILKIMAKYEKRLRDSNI